MSSKKMDTMEESFNKAMDKLKKKGFKPDDGITPDSNFSMKWIVAESINILRWEDDSPIIDNHVISLDITVKKKKHKFIFMDIFESEGFEFLSNNDDRKLTIDIGWR